MFRRYILGKQNPSQDWDKIAADIASDSHKMRGFAYASNALFNETLSGQMLGLFSQLAQIVQDPADRQRYKDWLRPTVSTKLYALGSVFLHTLQQGKFNSNDWHG